MGILDPLNGTERTVDGVIVPRNKVSIREIVEGPSSFIRDEIRRLFLQAERSIDIATKLNGVLPVEKTATLASRASLVRKIIGRITTKAERKEMTRKKHKKRAERNHAKQDAGRDRAFAERGMKVWTAEEKLFFRELLNDNAYLRDEQRATKQKGERKRRRHYNHAVLARAMNQKFATNEFTPERTMSRLDLLRAQERAREREARLSELSADEGGQLDETVGVAPLVVVPTEGLHERS